MEGKRMLLACGAITVLAIAIIAGVIFAMSHSATPPQTLPTSLTTSGTLACLPHKNAAPGQPQTLECAIGLRTEDGTFYALRSLPQDAASTDFNKHVTVSGSLAPPSAQEKYNIIGTITVASFKTN